MSGIAVVAGLAIGSTTSLLTARAARDVLAHPMLGRTNVRGRTVATAGGVLALVATIAVAGGTAVVEAATDTIHADWSTVLVAVLGFGMLGLLDDVLGGDDAKGFGGHLRALRRGRVTTGFVKLAGGGALAFVLARRLRSAHDDGAAVLVAVDAAVIALAANLGNLFDRAPGRVLKMGVIAWVPAIVGLAASVRAERLVFPIAAAFGALLGLVADDLGERYMLGDTGANVVGALAGLTAVAAAGASVRIAVAIVLLALNLSSERVSFSRVIDSSPPLRWLDRLGRRP